METNVVFNITVCIIGIAIFLVHTVDLLLKKNKRQDEKNLLIFIVFTIIHFATYLTFTFIKISGSNDTLIISFYTTFYVMNNIESLLLFVYTLTYITVKNKTKDIIFIVNFILFAIFIILDVVNVFNHMFFYALDGVYKRTSFMFFSQGYQLVTFSLVFFITVFNK